MRCKHPLTISTDNQPIKKTVHKLYFAKVRSKIAPKSEVKPCQIWKYCYFAVEFGTIVKWKNISTYTEYAMKNCNNRCSLLVLC